MDNRGTWFNKFDFTDFINIFDEEEQPPDGYTIVRPLPNTAYQKFNNDTERWEPDPEAEIRAEIETLKHELAALDDQAGSGRAIRGLTLASASKEGFSADPDSANFNEDFARLQSYEVKAIALRDEIERLKWPVASVEAEESV